MQQLRVFKRLWVLKKPAGQITVIRCVILAVTLLLATLDGPPARAEFIDHEAGCRQWQQIAIRIYAQYEAKYKTIWFAMRSQAHDEEAQARALGWNEDYIKHLLMIVSNAQSGRWTTLDQFANDEYSTCMTNWQAISTPEERAAEAKEIARRKTVAATAQEATMERERRVSTCTQYESVAWHLIGLQHSGASYKSAAEWAASAAYGPSGQVLRFSEENANAFIALAAAVYFARDKYGQNDQVFAQRALDGCVRGELLDASPKN
jgi:hypothetical protein